MGPKQQNKINPQPTGTQKVLRTKVLSVHKRASDRQTFSVDCSLRSKAKSRDLGRKQARWVGGGETHRLLSMGSEMDLGLAWKVRLGHRVADGGILQLFGDCPEIPAGLPGSTQEGSSAWEVGCHPSRHLHLSRWVRFQHQNLLPCKRRLWLVYTLCCGCFLGSFPVRAWFGVSQGLACW